MTDGNQRSHERIEAAIAQLGSEYEPPPGWEARVLAATREAPRRRWWMFAGPAVALAAAAAIALYLLPGKPPQLALEYKLVHAGTTRGTDETGVVGDLAKIKAAGAAAIWIYHDDGKLVLRCPGAPACRSAGDALEVDVKIARVGQYKYVAVDKPLPAAELPGDYSGDVAAARNADAKIVEKRLVVP